MTATGPAIMEVDPDTVAGTAVDRFLDEPVVRGLNGETAVDRFLDELQNISRNAEHIAIIIVVDLVPIQSHLLSRRPQAQHPLY